MPFGGVTFIMTTRLPSRTSSILSPSCGAMRTRGSSAPSRIVGGGGGSGSGSSLGGGCCARTPAAAVKRTRKRTRRMAGFYPMVNTLLLVDGSSYLYRAFHALPELKSRGGGARLRVRRQGENLPRGRLPRLQGEPAVHAGGPRLPDRTAEGSHRGAR